MYCRNQLFLAWVMFILCQIVPLPVKSEEADSLKTASVVASVGVQFKRGIFVEHASFLWWRE